MDELYLTQVLEDFFVGSTLLDAGAPLAPLVPLSHTATMRLCCAPYAAACAGSIVGSRS
jgi:hypothetical protein